MPTESDIRRWFLKQPHSKDPGKAQNASKEEKFLNVATAVEDSDRDLKKTSKYFSGNSSAQKAKPIVDDVKPKSQKPSPSKKKRYSPPPVVETKSEFSPKKPRIVEKRAEIRSETPPSDDDFRAADEAPMPSPSPGRGRGRGRGRGGGSGVSGSAPEESKPAPAGRGRGGMGRGGAAYLQSRAVPPHKGEKEVPEGAEDCLAGLTFVISGTLDSLEREEAEDLIKRHGGRVTSAVSKKTSYLLADEDVGGQKSKKAKELGVSFISEDELFEKIRSSKHQISSGKLTGTKITGKRDEKASKLQHSKPGDPGSFYGTPAVSKRPAKAEALAPLSTVVKPTEGVAETEAWPQKYQPRNSSEIIGNQSMVKQLHNWLQHWDEQHLHGGKQQGKKRGTGSSSSNDVKKAALLSGSPGIGKTTSARLISKELGFEVFEVNASDSRGKADVKVGKGISGSTANSIKEMVSNESLAVGAIESGHKKSSKRKSVLIMDEVDGMSGGDRGGVTDLIASIKVSKIPIICICNDRYSQKLKSLVNYCLPLNFRKATKQQMAKRLLHVAEAEGMQVDEIALEELSERVNGDMRMALNELQYLSLRTRVVKFTDVKARLVSSAKDEDISPFNAVDKLMALDSDRLRMDARLDASMSDPDLVPLLIQENYLNYCPTLAGRDESGITRMDLIARAATSIADGDIVNVQIRRYQQWQHFQTSSFMSSIIPAALMHGRRETLVQGERNFNRFGGWLGKNSTFGKKMRLLADVHLHLLASRLCEPTRQVVRSDYLYALALHLTLPLRNMPKEIAVQNVVDFMEQYSITQEDVNSILDISKFQGQVDLMEGVQPAVKSALTKTYRQREDDRRVKSADLLPVFSPSGQKKALKKRAKLELDPVESYSNEDLQGEKESSDSEDEEETNNIDTLDVLKKANSNIQLTVVEDSSRDGSKKRGRGMQAQETQTSSKPRNSSKPGKRRKEG